MAGNLKMTFAQVQALAKALQAGSAKAMEDVLALQKKTDPTGIWEGAGADAYRAAWERYKKVESDLQKAVDELGRQVGIIEQKFSQIDGASQGTLNSFFG